MPRGQGSVRRIAPHRALVLVLCRDCAQAWELWKRGGGKSKHAKLRGVEGVAFALGRRVYEVRCAMHVFYLAC